MGGAQRRGSIREGKGKGGGDTESQERGLLRTKNWRAARMQSPVSKMLAIHSEGRGELRNRRATELVSYGKARRRRNE